MIAVSVMGGSHPALGIGNQDSVSILPNFICVTDGCSSTPHAEVGAQLFAHLARKLRMKNEDAFDAEKMKEDLFEEVLLPIFDDPISVIDHLLFTILMMNVTESHLEYHIQGDGYVILVDVENQFRYVEFDCNNVPNYYAYEFFEDVNEDLEPCQSGSYDKSAYCMAGLATDGLRFVLSNDAYRRAFESSVLQFDQRAIQQLFKQISHHEFSDDLTIGLLRW